MYKPPLNDFKNPPPLSKKFYQRNVIKVAKGLLGKIFVVNDKSSNHLLSGIIVEVEAYDGSIDKASHSYNGKTNRNEVMFREGGYLYVYFTYGIHFCANIVTGYEGEGSAVLIRGIQPVDGMKIMWERRFPGKAYDEKQRKNLTNGPAKICKSFGIERIHNGVSLNDDEIFIVNAPLIPRNKIVETKRIGIKKSVELQWRFYIKDNPYASKY